MTTALQLRRGTTTQHSSFTGANAEVTVDTTKKTLVVHDGVTPGGTPLAKEADAANRVRFDIASQGLTETQKGNARSNISAAKDPGAAGWIVRLSDGDAVARTLTAGSGISITNGDGASGNPVISNTGVKSVNGQTGDVTLNLTSPVTSVNGETGAVTTVKSINGKTGVITAAQVAAAATAGYGYTPADSAHTHSNYLDTDIGFSAVGSFSLLAPKSLNGGSSILQGSTHAGSNLAPARGNGDVPGTPPVTVTGTWRLLSATITGISPTSYSAPYGLFQRIS